MLRETTFGIGGILTIALGVLFAAGLFLAGAGFEYASAWLACGIAVGFGAFFLYVARDEHRDRLSFLAEVEKERPDVPGPRSR
ncbi:MAG: hypothetical protein WB786_03680 [Thermoplasmata archaeon]